MRARHVVVVFAVLPTFAAAQSLCNPCVDPGVGSPRRPSMYESVTATRSITADDMRRLGLVTAADLLNQLPSNSRAERPRNFALGEETLARLRRELASAQPVSAPPLVHETTVAAPLETVWRAWTTSAGLSAWLAPLAYIDLTIGGEMRVAYDAAAGPYSDMTVVNEVLAFDPPSMLAFRAARAPSNFPYITAVAGMWTVVYLDAVSADTTRVRVVVNGLGDDAQAQDAREFFESGNAETLRRLEERFGTPQ